MLKLRRRTREYFAALIKKVCISSQFHDIQVNSMGGSETFCGIQWNFEVINFDKNPMAYKGAVTLCNISCNLSRNAICTNVLSADLHGTIFVV